MATAPENSPFDPLGRLEDGEDRFVIREHDPVGPEAITGWTQLRRNFAYRMYGDDPSEEAQRALKAELAQCAEAEEKALAWRERATGGEAVEGEKKLYQDVERTEDQLAELDTAKKRALAIDHLREAAYRLCEAKGVLRDIGEDFDADALAGMEYSANGILEEQKAAA